MAFGAEEWNMDDEETGGLVCDWKEKSEKLLSSSLRSKLEKVPVVGEGRVYIYKQGVNKKIAISTLICILISY